MKTVWKFPFVPSNIVELPMPRGALVLDVASQGEGPSPPGTPCLWALVDPSAETEVRRFRVAGTGHPIAEELGRFVGTFGVLAGQASFHVWDLEN